MSDHKAHISWRFSGGEFLKGRYSREHSWTFDGGVTVPASPSPSNVPAPYSNAANVDPEEAYVAAIASCHMLSFLYVAYRERVEVASYEDDAVGTMTKNERGALWVSRVVLSPRVEYAKGSAPTRGQETQLHHRAHAECYIANSVRTEIIVRAARREDGPDGNGAPTGSGADRAALHG
jgi:organic hydroperoxide reductase OsmC/OhrA